MNGIRRATCVGEILTVRSDSGGELVIAVGVSDLREFDWAKGLLSWQFGFGSHRALSLTNVGDVRLLPPEAGVHYITDCVMPRLADCLTGLASKASPVGGPVFVSYVREDEDRVRELREGLTRAGIDVWQDLTNLSPGQYWEKEIREAIQRGEGFLACFSKKSGARSRTYMNKELGLAVDELALRPMQTGWFVPILLDPVEIPDLPIGCGRTLRAIQAADLYTDWDSGVAKLVSRFRPA